MMSQFDLFFVYGFKQLYGSESESIHGCQMDLSSVTLNHNYWPNSLPTSTSNALLNMIWRLINDTPVPYISVVMKQMDLLQVDIFN